MIGSTTVDRDEFPRAGTTPETLAKLRPAFIKDGTGTVTAGNASGINDGAAVVILGNQGCVEGGANKPMAKVVSWAQAGVDPSVMGMGPVPAVRGAVSVCLGPTYILSHLNVHCNSIFDVFQVTNDFIHFLNVYWARFTCHGQEL